MQIYRQRHNISGYSRTSNSQNQLHLLKIIVSATDCPSGLLFKTCSNHCHSYLLRKLKQILTQRVDKSCTSTSCTLYIRECGSTLYVGMAQGVSLSLYIGIGAKFENTQKTGERRLRTAEYRTVLL